MSHSKRGPHAARHPLHITLRVEAGLRSLRTSRAHNAVRDALAAGACRHGLRLVEYVVMSNHLHLVCEASDQRAVTRGMKGLGVRIARALNRLWSRAGTVFADRYHSRALRSPREVRNVLEYVLRNAAHHGIHFAGPDPCSSGAWFDGWRPHSNADVECASPLPRANTWLLALGWRRHGLIELP